MQTFTDFLFEFKKQLSWLYFCQGLTDTKIVSSSSRFNPMSVLRVPHQAELTPTYSQHSLHRSISRLIDGKSLMMEEGNWDNPPGHDSGMVRIEKFAFPGIFTCANYGLTGSLPVCGGRRACGYFKSLEHWNKRAHHVHRHTPVGQDGRCDQVSHLLSGYKLKPDACPTQHGGE